MDGKHMIAARVGVLKGKEASEALAALRGQYDSFLKQNIKIDMQRGRPCEEQLDLAREMLDWGNESFDCEDGNDARNYGGGIEGAPEARRLFAEIMGVGSENVVVCNNSSLSIMYNCIINAMLFGVGGDAKPWLTQVAESGSALKFLCPSPGYDRHFNITEKLGFEMIPIALNSDGPDMDEVERLIKDDAMIKGIWNIPKYSNPTGITYSDEVVRRFAALKPKANDFRIFWDNSYAVHDLYDEPDTLFNLYEEAKRNGAEDMVYMFASTSKITFAGSGVAAFASGEKNVNTLARYLSIQMICPDKMNQLRHVRYIKDAASLKSIMSRHAELIRSKFEAVLDILEDEFGDDICDWNRPRGGYFISLNAPDNCAKEAIRLAASLGVKFTPAGASFPYGNDPRDRNIRIAPTVPTMAEVKTAARILALCIKVAYLSGRGD